MKIEKMCEAARKAALELQSINTAHKNDILALIAKTIEDNASTILAANEKDVMLATQKSKPAALIDRLTINEKRIESMVKGVLEVRNLPDPVGVVTEVGTMPSGIRIRKMRVPLGVIGIIYEARPNVTVDAIALCVKSGNAVVLRGSSDALNSNLAIYHSIKEALWSNGYDADIVQMIESTDRSLCEELLQQDKYIDVIIPRGGEELKKFVMTHAKMPVLASAGGNCHTYVERTADLGKALNVLVNAKAQRFGVCNATEQLLVDRAIAPVFLPMVKAALDPLNVKIEGDPETSRIIDVPVCDESEYMLEHHAPYLTVKIVENFDEAIERINANNTKHSDCILTENEVAVKEFFNRVDSACLYHNVSTRFTDGFEFGLGAEMGISTGKLHVRGPIGLEGLTTEKDIVDGDYVIRK